MISNAGAALGFILAITKTTRAKWFGMCFKSICYREADEGGVVLSTKWSFVDLSSQKNSRDVIELFEINGAEPSLTKVKGSFYCTADLAIPGDSFPLKIPPENVKDHRSYWKTMMIRVTDWEGFAKLFQCKAVSDICIYPVEESVFGPCSLISDKWQLSTKGSGGILVGQRDDGEHGISLKDYAKATGIIGITGDPLESHHPYYSTQTVQVRKIDCYSLAKPCIFDKSIYKGPFDSRAIVTQLVVPGTAASGRKTSLELHFGAKIMLT